MILHGNCVRWSAAANLGLDGGKDAVFHPLSAAADDRSFIIGAYEGLNLASREVRLDLRLFQFRISGGGKPGHLTELAPFPARGQDFQGIALSPDGKLLAVSLLSGPDDNIGTLQVINLASGTIRTWTAPVTGPQYAPGAPSWVDGNRMIAFTWQRAVDQGPSLCDGGSPAARHRCPR